ncbi:MAG: site-2 protease family protein [Candidatus Nomurabacteria bacterium]|nr:MAG: site-2 protease family protein [Candidatus Nomurabacteria bacterium]HRV75789.1 site-2 protease family protein [Candidatus Saccharimonadales bacterium]
MLFVFGIFAFIMLVVLHEFGHMVAAKRNSVVVEEFGVGFPPKAWGKKLRKKKGDDTLYSLNWLPLGGFVKLKGEHDDSKLKGSFGAASLKTKVKILVAGVGMNFLTAWVLLTGLFLVGAPKLPFESLSFYGKEQFYVKSDTKVINSKTIIGAVSDDSPAQKAGLDTGDTLISINNVAPSVNSPVSEITNDFAGQEVVVKFENGRGEIQESKVTLREKGTKEGVLGVSAVESVRLRSTWSAPINALATMGQSTQATFSGVSYAISNLVRGEGDKASEVVGGPVATVDAINNVSKSGLTELILLIALISLSLGIMNILPIPALDGGRLFLILLFRFRGKVLTKEREESINAWGMGILLILIALITIVDVGRIF